MMGFQCRRRQDGAFQDPRHRFAPWGRLPSIMNDKLWVKFPIFLAVFFCLYAYGLIANSLNTYGELKNKQQTQLISESAQRAATLGDYLQQQRRFVVETAHGPDISNYQANKALGMSLQYGLQASLDAIEANFSKTLTDRQIGDAPLYLRLALVDQSGQRLVDTAMPAPPPPVDGRDQTLRISIDPVHAVVMIAAPVEFRGTPAGQMVAWIDLDRLIQFLLPASDESFLQYILTTDGGQPVRLPASLPDPSPQLLDRIAHLADGKLEIAPQGPGDPAAVLVKQPLAGFPLILTTIAPEKTLTGEGHSQAFLLIAGFFPPIVLLSAILFERMRQRNAQVELKLHATRLRLMGISDNLIEGIILISGNGDILFVNRPALHIMGVDDDPKRFYGQPLSSLLLIGKAKETAQCWHRVVEQGATMVNDDEIFVTPHGREVSVAFACTPLRDPQYGPGIIVSFRDISTLKQAQHEAMQSMRLASIGQLAAGIAHEINTPAQYIGDNLAYVQDGMTSLHAAVDAMRVLAQQAAEIPQLAAPVAALHQAAPAALLDELTSEMPLALKDCQDGIAQIARIVLSMKEFSHPGGQGQTAADINRALENTLTVSRNAWKHVAEVEQDFAPDLPLVLCHLGEINQVFINLIMNAVQAIETSGKPLPGRIHIRTACQDGHAVITVADSGNGVPDAIRDHIFDPFFTTKDVGKGSGQGLTICRDVVVNKHNGTIQVGTAPQGGASFTVRLPVDGVTAPRPDAAV